jgi:hypothetical protein
LEDEEDPMAEEEEEESADKSNCNAACWAEEEAPPLLELLALNRGGLWCSPLHQAAWIGQFLNWGPLNTCLARTEPNISSWLVPDHLSNILILLSAHTAAAKGPAERAPS